MQTSSDKTDTKTQRTKKRALSKLIAGEENAVPRLAYNVDQAAIMCGISRANLYRQQNLGKINFVKLAGRTLVTREELERFVSQNAFAA